MNTRSKVIILPLALALVVPSASFAATKPALTYSGWIPFWNKTSGMIDITNNLVADSNILQGLSPFSYEVRSDGTLVDRLKVDSGFWPNWLSAIQDMGIKIVPTIAWFDGNAIHKLLSNKTKRIAHEDAIKKLVVQNGYDGIDIDYEAKLAETKDYFSTFLYGLAIRLHPLHKTISCTIETRAPLAPGEDPASVPRANDYAVMNKYCDEVRLMAYDQNRVDPALNAVKGADGFYAPIADPDWVTKVLGEVLKEIKPNKVVLGVPTYGYEFLVTKDNGGTATYSRLRSWTYTEAIDLAKSMGITPQRNNAGELSFSYDTVKTVVERASSLANIASTLTTVQDTVVTTSRYVSFSDAKAAADKIALAKKMGWKGVTFFKLDGETDPLLWSEMK